MLFSLFLFLRAFPYLVVLPPCAQPFSSVQHLMVPATSEWTERLPRPPQPWEEEEEEWKKTLKSQSTDKELRAALGFDRTKHLPWKVKVRVEEIEEVVTRFHWRPVAWICNKSELDLPYRRVHYCANVADCTQIYRVLHSAWMWRRRRKKKKKNLVSFQSEKVEKGTKGKSKSRAFFSSLLRCFVSSISSLPALWWRLSF